MDAIEWTPWRVLTVVSVGLFVLAYPFLVRQMSREQGRQPGFAGSMVSQGGIIVLVLAGLFEWRTPMRDGLGLLGCFIILAGFFSTLIARRRAAKAASGRLESA